MARSYDEKLIARFEIWIKSRSTGVYSFSLKQNKALFLLLEPFSFHFFLLLFPFFILDFFLSDKKNYTFVFCFFCFSLNRFLKFLFPYMVKKEISFTLSLLVSTELLVGSNYSLNCIWIHLFSFELFNISRKLVTIANITWIIESELITSSERLLIHHATKNLIWIISNIALLQSDIWNK